MRFMKEKLLLEDEEFVKSIDSREPVDGKIRVTDEEWDRLWEITFGPIDSDVIMSTEDTLEWFRQTGEFAKKYGSM